MAASSTKRSRVDFSEMDDYNGGNQYREMKSTRMDITAMDGFEEIMNAKKSKRPDISGEDDAGYKAKTKKPKRSQRVDIFDMDGYEDVRKTKKAKKMAFDEIADLPSFNEKEPEEGGNLEDYAQSFFMPKESSADVDEDMDFFDLAPRKKTFKRGDIHDFEDKTRNGMFTVPTRGKRKVKKSFKPKKSKDPNNQLPSDDSDRETSSEEDIPNINLGYEKEFLQLLGSLKMKDPSIYKKDKEYFQRESSDEEEEEAENGTKYECPSDVEDFQDVIDTVGFAEGNAEELKQQKYIERQKNRSVDVVKYLKGEAKSLRDQNMTADLVVLRDTWTDPNLNAVDRYLRDYILDRKYIQNDDDPINDELIRMDAESSEDSEEEWRRKKKEMRDKKTKKKKKTKEPASKIPKPKYKFRFQEPDQEFTKRYPLQSLLSVRKPDTRRSEKNKQRRENKHKREHQNKVDIQKEKDTKRKALLDKLEGMITQKKEENEKAEAGYAGDDENPEEEVEEEFWYGPTEDLDPDDPNFIMDADYDPHEAKEEKNKKKSKKERKKKAKNAKNKKDDTDVVLEAAVSAEPEKLPEVPEYTEEDVVEPKVAKPKSKGWMAQNNEEEQDGPYWDDPDFNMDADYDPNGAEEQFDEDVRDKRKSKKGSKDIDDMFALEDALERVKETVGPANEELEKLLDEYNKLECDMLEGIPFRFKYRDVTATNFGLSMDEILEAEDEELEKWCPLQDILQRKNEEEEKTALSKFKKQSKVNKRKKYVFHSLYGGKKQVSQPEPMEEGTSKTDQMVAGLGVNNDRLRAYGITSLPRYKRWLAYDKTRNMDRNISGIEIVANDD